MTDLAQERMQLEVIRRLADAPTAHDAAVGVLETVARDLQWDVAFLWMRSEEGGLLGCVSSWSRADPSLEEFRRACERLTFAPNVGLMGRVWGSGRAEWLEELPGEAEFPRAGLAAKAGLRSVAAAPVQSVGVLELLSRAARPHDAEQETVIRTVAGQLAHYMGRLRTESRLRESEERLGAIFDAALDCVMTMDHRGRVVDMNPAAEQTFGYTREDASGQLLADLIVPEAMRAAHLEGLARYLEKGKPRILGRRLELSARRADGSVFPVELTITRLGRSHPPLFAGFMRDITERFEAEQERRRLVKEALASRASEEAARVHAEIAQAAAEADRKRMEFLAAAGLRMAASMDYETTLRAVARSAIPDIADGCIVTVLDERGNPLPLVTAGSVDAVNVLTANIEASGRKLGEIALLRSKARFEEGDRVMVRSLGARAGLHIDNARLYTERSRIAHTLQQGLLPAELPAIPHMQLAARYRAAGEQNEVGGDFYDVFESDPGVWTAVVGDVSGKGAKAASLTALARHTLYAAALRDPSPARNLAFLNQAMLRRSPQADAFCTVVCARLDGRTVTLASGGHPTPFVARADGTVTAVDVGGTLVGALDDATFDLKRIELSPGDTLFLYTDGAIELRGHPLSVGEAELCRVLKETAADPVDTMVAAVLRRITELQDERLRDDVALLALRAQE